MRCYLNFTTKKSRKHINAVYVCCGIDMISAEAATLASGVMLHPAAKTNSGCLPQVCILHPALANLCTGFLPSSSCNITRIQLYKKADIREQCTPRSAYCRPLFFSFSLLHSVFVRTIVIKVLVIRICGIWQPLPARKYLSPCDGQLSPPNDTIHNSWVGEASAIIGVLKAGFSLATALNTEISDTSDAADDIRAWSAISKLLLPAP